MTRPALNPANMRRQSTRHKVGRTIRKWVTVYLIAITIGIVYVYVFDPALNPLI